MDESVEPQKTEEYPIEYQVFALSMRTPGAIGFFDSNLPESIVGSIHGQTGINEFYRALISYYHTTKLDTVDAVAFRILL